MTGGIGFSRQGKDSFKQNRDLRIARPGLKDNPYTSHKKISIQEAGNKFDELKAWKKEEEKNKKHMRNMVYLGFSFLFIIVLILVLM
ncbi:hypothetical protein [Mongoliibacter ruber]|uniref:Uncharacterized protein n=1 Tax=Mongoliibacter ruber TaxID=1750599 RepID=A0A2T0WQW3_9BACT|nr:hypothetical protein [Mongoliibacter ruber]PRY89103.1 hypothetical protein CLW00_103225 [Mongoliibacter ruber]